MVKKLSENVKSQAAANKEIKKRYWAAVGRRKTAVARVRILDGSGEIAINKRTVDNYFPLMRFKKNAIEPLKHLKLENKYNAIVKVSGGGVSAQAGAVSHGLARALSLAEPDFKLKLRQAGLLTRDSRMVERKKYGLKKARRAPQWAKR